MNAYRKIVEVKNHTLNLLLPDNFNNGKVEVIVFPVNNEVKKNIQKPSDFGGLLDKDIAISMLNEIEESRTEWERDI
jgi:hypothetical protein